MPLALVTGTSSGIGLSTAVLLARAGFRVVATMRDAAKSGALLERAKAEGLELEVRPLDVCDPASVEACVAEVKARHGGVDVLVNNAGAGYLGGLEHTPAEDLRANFEVNFFGVWAVTRAVAPLMREARTGRIVSVTSVGGLFGQPFNDAYCAAKFAVEGLMESLAPVMRGFGVHVSLVEPGPVNTEFISNLGASLARRQADAKDPYRPMLEAYLKLTRERFSAGQTPDEVAGVIVEAATAPAPHFRYATSPMVRALAAQKYVDPTGDAVLAMMASRLGL